ncbi:MAG TPA: flagellar basal body rod protein FlgB, partial [Cobetia sp.]|nr:flagellar basal body rod protein FlgB [Cobetia sp.]
GADLLYRVPTQPSLDGNTVDMDVERVNFADNSLHYEASLELLTGKIQGLRLAMQSENS